MPSPPLSDRDNVKGSELSKTVISKIMRMALPSPQLSDAQLFLYFEDVLTGLHLQLGFIRVLKGKSLLH